jgi:hypothetical protein
MTSLCLHSIEAKEFDPEVTLMEIENEVRVKTPDDLDFKQAVEGLSYVYGTMIKTGPESMVKLSFSEGNYVRMYEKTSLTISEDALKKKLKMVKLHDGKLRIKLEESFHKRNEFQVETPTAVCGALGTEFDAEHIALTEGEKAMEVSIFGVLDKRVNIKSDYFKIDSMGEADRISFARSKEGNYHRLKVVNGNLRVDLRENADDYAPVTSPRSTEFSFVDTPIKQHQDGRFYKVVHISVRIPNKKPETRSFTEWFDKMPEGLEMLEEEPADPKKTKVGDGETPDDENAAVEENPDVPPTQDGGSSEDGQAKKKKKGLGVPIVGDVLPVIGGVVHMIEGESDEELNDGTEPEDIRIPLLDYILNFIFGGPDGIRIPPTTTTTSTSSTTTTQPRMTPVGRN